MDKVDITTMQNFKTKDLEKESKVSTIILDLISLFKGLVLITNILPVLTGFCLALYFTNASFGEHWKLFIITIIGSTLVVAGALTLNNWYEVDLDREMARTQKRPTVTGNFSLKTVLVIGIILSTVGFLVLFFTTIEALVYAFLGWITYVVFYTFWSKRKYTLNTAIGSISGAVTPLIGWAAIAPSYHIVPIVLALLLFIWQIPHTFAIGIRRCEEYKAAGVAMLPVVRGFAITKRQIAVYVACLLPLPFLLPALGLTFIIIATVLNVVFLGLSIAGFYTKNDVKWARVIFLYSVNYLTIIFFMMIFIALPVFSR
jgi:heme o synthase